MKSFIKKHPFLTAVLASLIFGLVLAVGSAFLAFEPGAFAIPELFGTMLSGSVIFGGFIGFPLALTAAEIILLVKGRKDHELHRKGVMFDLVGLALGVSYSWLYLGIVRDVRFESDWTVQLVNAQTHTPVCTESLLTVVVVALLAVAGYLLVNGSPLEELPPLALVLGLAAMYAGTVESVVWGIQVFRADGLDVLLLLLPLNCLFLTARTVSHKMWEWERMLEEDPDRRERYREGGGVVRACNRFLSKSGRWPLAAFLLMWPLLGVVVGGLILFGQRPDAVIRAFTETSDWNLSRRVAPQNVHWDEHYLCTVAAGGHERIVKPRRLGVRHGHQVIVNRQLCVANAFEQLLEERTPRLHRSVRRFYDACGFPVARLIRSRFAADVVYVLMKPLEWVFLAVLYLTDANPENRIAIQYTGKSLKDLEKTSL